MCSVECMCSDWLYGVGIIHPWSLLICIFNYCLHPPPRAPHASLIMVYYYYKYYLSAHFYLHRCPFCSAISHLVLCSL